MWLEKHRESCPFPITPTADGGGFGHLIPTEKPDAVIAAVNDMVAGLRGKRHR